MMVREQTCGNRVVLGRIQTSAPPKAQQGLRSLLAYAMRSMSTASKRATPNAVQVTPSRCRTFRLRPGYATREEVG